MLAIGVSSRRLLHPTGIASRLATRTLTLVRGLTDSDWAWKGMKMSRGIAGMPRHQTGLDILPSDKVAFAIGR